MSKNRHNKYIDTIDECLSNGVKNGIFQVNITSETLNGRTIQIDHSEVVNFGSCSYLGLEMNEQIREAGKQAFDKYGSQYSASRLFSSCGLYKTAEEKLSEMFFNYPVIISPTTTLAHIAAIPILVEDDDLIIIDHQVHGSIQMAVQLPKSRGVQVEMIRHNNLAQLEEIIIVNRNKYNKIWYFIDGLYSMYGDYAPLTELIELLNKYPELYLYADDAHGMSWTGKNGTGFIMSRINMHPKMVLTTSLNKAFATGGGLLVLPNQEMKRKILTCGSSFTFSGPLQPPTLGAIMASADIHLSSEIYQLQEQLAKRTNYALKLIEQYKLPLLAPNESPIFYIGLGLPKVGYNIVKRLLNEGYYTNIGIFPGVPVKCTGLRLAINNNQKMEDIKGVLEAFAYHFPKAIEEEQQMVSDISTNFKIDFSETERFYGNTSKQDKEHFIIDHKKSIKEIDQPLWDSLLGDNGTFDWNGCLFLEETFCNNPEPENNWKFNYLIIKDQTNKPILATFFTELLCKEDMISAASVSEKIEKKRENDPYFLTSKVIMMGSLLTEGNHLYIDRTHPEWKNALREMIKIMTKEKLLANANAIQIRDIDSEDEELKDFFIEQGFVKAEMPDSHVIYNTSYKTIDSYTQDLSKKSRYHVKKYAQKNENKFRIEILDNKSTNTDPEYYKNLYLNIKVKSYNLNTFNLPSRLFENILKHKNWEAIALFLDNNKHTQPVGIVFCYQSAKNNYCPMIIGLDYSYNTEFNIYRQSLYQMVKRGILNNFNKIYLGMDASVEKQKFGAQKLKKSIYIQSEDNFNMELISLIKTNR